MTSKRMIDTIEDMANGLYKAGVMKPEERLGFAKDLKELRDKNRKKAKKKQREEE